MSRAPFLLMAAVIIVIPPPMSRRGAVSLRYPGLLRGPEGRGKAGQGLASSPVMSPLTAVPSPHNPLVAVRFTFRVGSQDDPPGKEGLAALTAELVARGSSRGLTADQVVERHYPLAAGLSVECHKEVTTFSSEVDRDILGQYMPVVASLLTIPRFDPDELERFRAGLLARAGSAAAGGDSRLALVALDAVMYPDHPYAHPRGGTAAGLRSITLADVENFFRTHYTREALFLGLAGEVVPRDYDFLRNQLSLMASGRNEPAVLPEPRPEPGLSVVLLPGPVGTGRTAVVMGFPIDHSPADDDLEALAVAQSYLQSRHRPVGESAVSPATEGEPSEVGDDADDDLPGLLDAADPRRQPAFVVRLAPRPPAEAASALRATLDDLQALARDGLDPAGFASARDTLLHATRLNGQTLSRRLAAAIGDGLLGRDGADTAAGRLGRLTADRFNAAVRRHLVPAGVQVVVMSDDATAFTTALRPAAQPPARPEGPAALSLDRARVSVVPASRFFGL